MVDVITPIPIPIVMIRRATLNLFKQIKTAATRPHNAGTVLKAHTNFNASNPRLK
jgi:hypothetical protein